ncbi:DODA-type extradiol aromatic ring-opening family dioxygenase [Nocardia takedensis]
MFLPVEHWPLVHKMTVGDVPQPAEVSGETIEVLEDTKERIDSGFAGLRAALAAARPDVVVIAGDDQNEVFGPPVNPTLAVYCGEEVSGSTLVHFRDQGLDETVRLACHSDVARGFAAGLIERGFDPAMMTELRPMSKPEGIGHAFTRPAHALGLAEAGIPIVPIFLNSYHEPLPSAQRCYDLGRAIREIADSRPERIAVVGSGGLSHDPGGPRAGWIDEPLDRWVLDRVSNGRGADLTSLFTFKSDTLQGGSGEIRSWIVMAGALPEVAADVIDYIPVRHGITGLAFASWTPAGQSVESVR